MPEMTRLVLVAVFCALLQVHAQQVTVVGTDSDLRTPMETKAPLILSKENVPSSLVITVNSGRKYQTIDGFGASLTDSSAWLLYTKLAPAQRNEIMHALFDSKRGIGLSFLRQPMGASDLALNDYSYDDVPAGQSDPDLKHFSVEHDNAYVLPLLREAIAINPEIKVIASPWSPPGWMKTTGTMIGGSLKQSAYEPLAQYFVRFIQAYEAAGVPIYGITMQNEPLYVPDNYPGMNFPAAAQLKFLHENLGPALARANLHPKVMLYDHNWDKPEYPVEILSDPAPAKYAAGIAWHCYGGNTSAQSVVHDKFPDKNVWETECSGGTWQKGDLLAEGARLLIESTRNWAKSVVLWNMALDQNNGPHTGGCDTCRGVVTVDTSKTPPSVAKNADFYVLGHASKFIRPGAVRIDSNSYGATSIEDVAFENTDGSIALIVLNNAVSSQTFSISDDGGLFTCTLPAGSLATFTWNSAPQEPRKSSNFVPKRRAN
jgi:glucosylceramidase